MGKTLKTYAEWRLQENLVDYSFYAKRFKRLLISMFKWENMPDGISVRYLEETLYENGLAIFYKSEHGLTKGSFIVTKATPINLNLYGEPTGYRAYSANGLINEHVKACDCVPIWNDYMREGNVGNINFFAKRLSNVEKTIDSNLEQLKTPVIITCPEGQRETVKQAWKKKTNGEPMILVDEDFSRNTSFQVWDMKAQNHIPQLEDTQRKKICDALTFFGINNVNITKRERLIKDEATQNNQEIFLNNNAMLKARKEAVKNINEKFGLNISVDVSRETLEQNIDGLLGGEENG